MSLILEVKQRKKTVRARLKSKAWNERGQAMIEIALVSGILFFILLGIAELVVEGMKNKRASTISREGALLGLQDCGDYTDPGVLLDSCLEAVRSEVSETIDTFFSGFSGTLILSLYATEPSIIPGPIPPPLPPAGETEFTGCNFTRRGIVGEVLPDFTSKYDNETIDPDDELCSTGHEVLVVAEFYNPNKPFTPIGDWIGIRENTYASTVI